jgi:hypothetical protein
MLYSPMTGGFYAPRINGSDVPDDCIPLTADEYAQLLQGLAKGQQIHLTAEGTLQLVKPAAPTLTVAELVQRIDTAADAARRTVAGDPLRAVEYERAAAEAQAFAAADYQGEVPRTVAAWALNGRTPRQAADSILAEAAAYTEALYQIRETRLQAKELIRQAMASGDSARAEDIAAETVATIEAAVHGVGNAGR